MHAMFIFDLGANQHIVYRVKDVILPPSSSLLTALGFEFVLSSKVTGGPAGSVLIPAGRLAHISYYEGVDLGDIPQCRDAVIVHVIHR